LVGRDLHVYTGIPQDKICLLNYLLSYISCFGRLLDLWEIGVLNAVYFAVAVIGHPFLGFIYDRSSNKHVVIACTSILAAASGFLVPFQSEPVGRIVVYALFSLFLSSLMPLLDAWSLIWCREGGHSFETIRVWGSYGYLFSSVLGGLALDRAGLVWAYYIPALVLLGICLSVFAFPRNGGLCIPIFG